MFRGALKAISHTSIHQLRAEKRGPRDAFTVTERPKCHVVPVIQQFSVVIMVILFLNSAKHLNDLMGNTVLSYF